MTISRAVCFAAGIATWPALEYGLHRVLAHTVKFGSKFKTEHLKHHQRVDYFAGTADKLKAAVPSSTGLFLLSFLLLGEAPAALAYTGGFLCSYLFYEWTHKRLHTHAPLTRLGLSLRRHHLLHHCVDARGNHGVTTKLFDRLFGTLVPSEHVAMPKSLAPRWALDEDGRIAAAYRRDFSLLSPGS